MKKFLSHPLVIAHLVLILLIGGFFIAKIFAWPAYKDWQNNRLFEQATQLAEDENFENAYLAIRKVIIQTEDPEAWKLALHIAEQLPEKYEMIPQLLNKLTEIDPDNPEHFQKLCLIGLSAQQPEFAKSIFDKYPETGKGNITYHSLGYQIAMRLNDTEEATKHLKALNELDPENTEFTFLLSAMNIRSKEAGTQTEAKATLETLSNDPKARMPALRALLSNAIMNKNKKEALAYADQILRADSPSLGDRLSAMEAYQLFQPEKTEAMINAMDPSQFSKAGEQFAILDFLIKYQNFDIAKEWIKNLPDELLNNEVLSPKIAQVYYLTQDWAALTEAIKDADWKDKDFGRNLLLGLASRAQGDEYAFRDYWEQALLQTNQDPDVQKMMIQQILRWNWKAEAIEVMQGLYKQNPQDDELYAVLTRYYLNTNKTPDLVRHLQLRLEYKPKDLIAKNNLALISLIKGQNLSSAFAYARANYDADANDPSFTTTWILALVLQDRAPEALELIQQLSQEERTDPQRCIYLAYAYYKADKIQDAEALLNQSSPEPIFKEEHDILDETRRAIEAFHETEAP